MGKLILPNDRQRITIIGKTGSGKTQAAAWLLSKRSYTTKPWIVFDFKYDDLLGRIPGKEEISLTARLPKYPGLYIVHPGPADKEAVENMLWTIWQRENTGVYIDEGYMIPRTSAAFQSVLTQGRSKHIPVIMLTQRPVDVTRFAFSEADYVQCFQLTDQRDIKTVREFAPLPVRSDLPDKYFSYWYDSTRNYRAILQPVPQEDTILDRFYSRLVQPRRVI